MLALIAAHALAFALRLAGLGVAVSKTIPILTTFI
jgi:hypothetical protein